MAKSHSKRGRSAGRGAGDDRRRAPSSSHPSSISQRPVPQQPTADIWTILGRLLDDIAIVQTASRAIDAAEIAEIGSESTVLKQGVSRLLECHAQLDLAICRLEKVIPCRS
jgi:hypothetical protein